MKKPGEERKKTASKKGVRGVEREKETRRDEEKDILLARIGQLLHQLKSYASLTEVAELESRLSALTPPGSGSSGEKSRGDSGDPTTKTWIMGDPDLGSQDISMNAAVQGLFEGAEILPAFNSPTGVGPDWDFGNLFLVPTHWPRNLPSPCTLILACNESSR